MQDRLSLVRSKLERAAALDRDLRTFGAGGHWGHRWIVQPPLDDATLNDCERRLGHRLPDDLRMFLLSISGGGAGPDYGLVPLTTALDEYDAFAREVAEDDSDAMLPSASRPMPFAAEGQHIHDFPCDGIVLLGESGCGGWSCLSIAGPLRGTVWYVDVYAGGARWSSTGLHFLDWYEDWLDRSLAGLT